MVGAFSFTQVHNICMDIHGMPKKSRYELVARAHQSKLLCYHILID